MNAKRVGFASFLFLILALLLMLIQHWGMSFSNADDPWIAQLGYASGVVQGSIDTAKLQGRFGFIPVLTIAQWPYLMDSWAFVNTLRILVNGFVFLGFVLFCAKLTNKYTGVLMGLVWLALIDINSSNYSPIHGFLLFFNLQYCFLFMSLYFFLDRLEKYTSGQLIVLPYLLFGFALLAYEPMVFYSLVFPALYMYKQMQSHNPAHGVSMLMHAKKFLTQNYVLAVVLALYLAFYFGFKKLYATGGQGLDFSGGLSQILKTIVNFSIHGFNIQYKPFTAATLALYSNSALLLAALFAGLIVIAMFLIVPRIEEQLTPSIMYKKKSLVLLGFFIFSPNLLYGFMEGYRKWANYDPHYVGNYFSSFPLAMAITLLVLYLVGGNKSRREKVLFLLILYVFFSSACDNYLRWGQLAETNRKETVSWQTAIHNLSQRKFEPNHETQICAVNAPRNISGDDRYWSQYLSRKFSADIQYVSNRISTTSCDITLDFQER